MTTCQVCRVYRRQEEVQKEGLSFHRFPIRDEIRCQRWLEFCNLEHLFRLSKEELHKCFVCRRHFRVDDYMNPRSKTLVHNAVPSQVWTPQMAQASSLQNRDMSQVTAALPLQAQEDFRVPVVPETIPNADMSHVTAALPLQAQEDFRVPVVPVTIPNADVSHVTASPSQWCKELCGAVLDVPISSTAADMNHDSLSVSACTYAESKQEPVPSTPLCSEPSKESIRSGKRGSILKPLGFSFIEDLTPTKRKMHQYICYRNKLLRQMRKKLTATRAKATREAHARSLMSSLEKYLTPPAAGLFRSQILSASRQPRGRRWGVSEKALATAIFKRSPTCYRFLRNVFALPSPRTISRSLQNIPFHTGLNEGFLCHLKELNKSLSDDKKICTLLFDEVSLAYGLHYDIPSDRVVGLEDYGHVGCTDRAANHALVFMIRGLLDNWKQPVAYYFSRGATRAQTLKLLIIKVIEAMQDVGFNVVATVCDQAATNQSAVKMLIRETQTNEAGPFFEVGGKQIFTIWDTPHLIKCMRNNLHKYNVEFEPDKIAKWLYLEKFYDIDSNNPWQLCSKLTQDHIHPVGMKSMKVKFAAQVMSNTVAAAIANRVIRPTEEYDKCIDSGNRHYVLPAEAIHLSEFLKLGDQLFDSFNGSTYYPEKGKVLRSHLSKDSPHIAFWDAVDEKIAGWKFVNSDGEVVPNSFQQGLRNNISAVKKLWEKLSEMGVESLNLRRLNQDPLENFFCIIRQQGYQNTNPTCSQFIAAFKSAIVKNFVNRGIKEMGNCEDDGASPLSQLTHFFEQSHAEHVVSEQSCEPFDVDIPSSSNGLKTVNDAHKSNVMADVCEAPEMHDHIQMIYHVGHVPMSYVSCSDADLGVMPISYHDEAVNGRGCVASHTDPTVSETYEIRRPSAPYVSSNEIVKDVATLPTDASHLNMDLCRDEYEGASYTVGYFVRKVLDKISCGACRDILTVNCNIPQNLFIRQKENDEKRRLCNPSPLITRKLVKLRSMVDALLQKHFSSNCLLARLKKSIFLNVDLTGIGCDAHADSVQERVVNIVCKRIIYKFCNEHQSVNRKRKAPSTSQPYQLSSACKKVRRYQHK